MQRLNMSPDEYYKHLLDICYFAIYLNQNTKLYTSNIAIQINIQIIMWDTFLNVISIV